MDKDIILNIDSAIHNPEIHILNIKGIDYNVFKHSNGCRALEYSGITFIEQNKKKNNIWGNMARKGSKITWGIRPNKWIQIINNQIIAN